MQAFASTALPCASKEETCNMSPFFNGFQLNVVHWTDDAEFALRTPSMIPPPCTFWVDDQSWPQSKVLYTKYYVLEYVSYTLCFSPGRQIFIVGHNENTTWNYVQIVSQLWQCGWGCIVAHPRYFSEDCRSHDGTALKHSKELCFQQPKYLQCKMIKQLF